MIPPNDPRNDASLALLRSLCEAVSADSVRSASARLAELARGQRDGSRHYLGARKDGRCVVALVESGAALPLLPRFDIARPSPDGFEWGYGGSGPAQLAIAILADNIPPTQVLHLHQRYKWSVIAKLPSAGPWMITSAEVRAWVHRTMGRAA